MRSGVGLRDEIVAWADEVGDPDLQLRATAVQMRLWSTYAQFALIGLHTNPACARRVSS